MSKFVWDVLFSASTASASPTFSGKIQMRALHDAPLFFDVRQYVNIFNSVVI